MDLAQAKELIASYESAERTWRETELRMNRIIHTQKQYLKTFEPQYLEAKLVVDKAEGRNVVVAKFGGQRDPR